MPAARATEPAAAEAIPAPAPNAEGLAQFGILPEDDLYNDSPTPSPISWWYWWNTCNGRGQHYAYLPPLPGWYYFRPYSMGQLARSASWPTLGRHPNPDAVFTIHHNLSSVIRWPDTLNEARFETQRTRIEAQFRGGHGAAAHRADYHEILDAATELRNQLAQSGDDPQAMAFLDQLTAEANARLHRREQLRRLRRPLLRSQPPRQFLRGQDVVHVRLVVPTEFRRRASNFLAVQGMMETTTRSSLRMPSSSGSVFFAQRAEHLLRRFAARKIRQQLGEILLGKFHPARAAAGELRQLLALGLALRGTRWPPR